jgi:hypothetical protein
VRSHAFLDEILDDDNDKISEYSSDEDNTKGDGYMQLVLPGTNKISDSDDGDNTVTKYDEQMGMG